MEGQCLDSRPQAECAPSARGLLLSEREAAGVECIGRLASRSNRRENIAGCLRLAIRIARRRISNQRPLCERAEHLSTGNWLIG